MVGARFLDVDFIAIKLPSLRLTGLHSRKGGAAAWSASRSQCRMEAPGRVRGMRGSTSREANPILSCRRTSRGSPPVGGLCARKALNAETIAELHRAFRIGGRQAINKVMRNNPAVFLKLLVLLVPREMKVEHGNPLKAMTTEQIERGIELVKEMIAKRDAAANAKLVEGAVLPAEPSKRRKPRRPNRKPGDYAREVLASVDAERAKRILDVVAETKKSGST